MSGISVANVPKSADARLIAAAPDLLAALEVLADVASSLDVTFSSPAEESTAEEALGMAHAAIAKARGGK